MINLGHQTTEPLPRATILLVSPYLRDRLALQRILADSKWKLSVCGNCRDGLDLLRRNPAPVVICDAESVESNWRRLVHELADFPDPPCLIVSSRLPDERLWAEVLNLGGYDLLGTPFDPSEVMRISSQASEFWQREHQRARSLRAAG